ncbi:glyoxalase superfamily protein [Cupriavidus sp. D39]|uniref:glyoxalase superfamily protein n=1 Tax=Cupriavidus sp. D39 TaxID=2997877 RepID=UPI00226DA2F5|nr:glyoxalase superfamily protein [Cupriavidus sp. D39]MCY0856020.1 glyoxalase superfamily protein [Cupriavidus sp. D39]
MPSEHTAFPVDFNVDAFFSAMPANLKHTARNGESHLKILKAQGKRLKSHLEAAFALRLTSAQALDAAARSYGFSDYNQAREALLKTQESKISDSDYPWVDLAAACREGGYVIGGHSIVEHLTLSPTSVITGLNVFPKDVPQGWYLGAAARYSNKALIGNKHFVIRTENPNSRQNDLVVMLIERAQRLARVGLQSFLLLNKCNVDDELLCELFSSRREFTPIITGYAAACTGEEGVPRYLWSSSAYGLFLSQTDSTSVLRETMRHVAQTLGVTEERALNLLINVPDSKYLRIPPTSDQRSACP